MNRKLKETSVDRDYYDSQEQLREHLVAFLLAYNLAKRLKPLRGLTPYEYLVNIGNNNLNVSCVTRSRIPWD